MYTSTTQGIKVDVEPQFLPSQSSAEDQFFLYAYRVIISNQCSETIQLLRRRWLIRNGHGYEEQVEGEGVVGKQPVIQPGYQFEYASGCPLTTPTGNMRGTYLVKTSSNQLIHVKVPLFFLRPPEHPRRRLY